MLWDKSDAQWLCCSSAVMFGACLVHNTHMILSSRCVVFNGQNCEPSMLEFC